MKHPVNHLPYVFVLIVMTHFSACKNANNASKGNADDCTVVVNDRQEVELCDTAEFALDIPVTGRYKLQCKWKDSTGVLWIEDHINNKDDRTYDITGKMRPNSMGVAGINGAPLRKGQHHMRLHVEGSPPDSIFIEPMVADSTTSDTLIQSMDGTEWELVWSDEFEGSGFPDQQNWSYNIGNWGWGNNELQYYTVRELENAQITNGALQISAIHTEKNGWTSARLTTQGNKTFLYGRFEFRAKVPPGRGAWAAGWLLGDAYIDELSWPYCGEIDVLECVGYEINDSTGSGKNHGTCHTPAYYFKKGNQISGEIRVDSMYQTFHTYAMEWYQDSIRCFVDGVHYYTYDKNENALEWPFDQPQNIIINLAVGGGWGGLKGIDSSWHRHQYIIDYIRVYKKA